MSEMWDEDRGGQSLSGAIPVARRPASTCLLADFGSTSRRKFKAASSFAAPLGYRVRSVLSSPHLAKYKRNRVVGSSPCRVSENTASMSLPCTFSLFSMHVFVDCEYVSTWANCCQLLLIPHFSSVRDICNLSLEQDGNIWHSATIVELSSLRNHRFQDGVNTLHRRNN
jgi:hypothetical protein